MDGRKKKACGKFRVCRGTEKKLRGDWTVSVFRREHREMEHGADWLRRQEELLAKLAVRAASCPGLYPFREATDFLRVAKDHAGPGPAEVCRILETLWQHPEQAIQMNAQSLIQRGKGWKETGDAISQLRKTS